MVLMKLLSVDGNRDSGLEDRFVATVGKREGGQVDRIALETDILPYIALDGQ